MSAIRLLRGVPLLLRMWWAQPQGVPREDLALAVAAPPAQVDHARQYSSAGAVARRWLQHQLFCGYGADALAIDTADNETREFLEVDLFTPRNNHELRLYDLLASFAEHALLALPSFIEIRLEEADRTHLDALRWWSPSRIRRRGYRYEIAAEGAPIRTVPADLMLDAELDLVGIALTADERNQLVDDFLNDRMLQQANLATAQSYAEPDRHGLRWDAARLRRINQRALYLAEARMTHVLGGSLIERRLYHGDKPPFTDHFVRWQLRDRLRRIEIVRAALIALVERKVLRPLIRRNGLAPASLRVRQTLSAARQDAIYAAAQEADLDPFKYYRQAAWPRSAAE